MTHEPRRKAESGQRDWARRMPALPLLLSALFLALPGCRSSAKVESELRRREAELREVKDELEHTVCVNESLHRQLGEIHSSNIGGPVCPEQVAATATVVKLVLGRQTGGYREDNCTADDALQVVVEPRDCDGSPLKAAGTVHIEALEIGKDGLKTPLSSWDLNTNQLGRTWKSGLWSSGYFIILPWKTRPTNEKLRVIVQLTLSDGRVFEADKDVTVRLSRNTPPVIPESLPPPRPLEKDKEGPALSSADKSPLVRAVHLGPPR